MSASKPSSRSKEDAPASNDNVRPAGGEQPAAVEDEPEGLLHDWREMKWPAEPVVSSSSSSDEEEDEGEERIYEDNKLLFSLCPFLTSPKITAFVPWLCNHSFSVGHHQHVIALMVVSWCNCAC